MKIFSICVLSLILAANLAAWILNKYFHWEYPKNTKNYPWIVIIACIIGILLIL